jgi:hypothetical protein
MVFGEYRFPTFPKPLGYIYIISGAKNASPNPPKGITILWRWIR